MKAALLFLSIRIFAASALISLGLLEISISAANAHPTLQQVVNALSYPRSSQRFLEEGQTQLETEIKYLQQKALALPPSLHIERELLQEQQVLQQKQERWLKDKLQEQGYR
jgi:hypothetical protein